MLKSKIRVHAPYRAMFQVVSKEVTVTSDKKKKEVRKVDILKPTSKCDERGSLLVLNIDQFSGKSFLLNPQGFPMNDIMIYEQAQSADVAEKVLRRINVLHPNNIDQNLTPEEMFEQIVPANYGSPAEFVRCSQIFANKYYARHPLNKPEDKVEDPSTVTFKPEDNPNVE